MNSQLQFQLPAACDFLSEHHGSLNLWNHQPEKSFLYVAFAVVFYHNHRNVTTTVPFCVSLGFFLTPVYALTLPHHLYLRSQDQFDPFPTCLFSLIISDQCSILLPPTGQSVPFACCFPGFSYSGMNVWRDDPQTLVILLLRRLLDIKSLLSSPHSLPRSTRSL